MISCSSHLIANYLMDSSNFIEKKSDEQKHKKYAPNGFHYFSHSCDLDGYWHFTKRGKLSFLGDGYCLFLIGLDNSLASKNDLSCFGFSIVLNLIQVNPIC